MAKRNRIRLASMLGLQIKQYSDDRVWSIYDGKLVHISTANPPIDIDHEIGHFIAATPRERTKPEWGLERGPDYPDDDTLAKYGIPNPVDIPLYEKRTKANDDRGWAREGAASLFGIAVSSIIGQPNEWREHAAAHTWERASTACDLFCLIRDSDQHHLKGRLTKVLAQLADLKGRL